MLLYMPGLAYTGEEKEQGLDSGVLVVVGWVTYLHAALDDIEGADSHVGQTAGKDTSDHAFAVVASVVDVTHLVGVFGLFSLKSQFSWITNLCRTPLK